MVGFVLVAACTGGGGGTSATPATTIEPLGPGVVTVPAWFDDADVLDVSRADDDGPSLEPLRALARQGGPAVVLQGDDDDPGSWIVASTFPLTCVGCVQGEATTSAGRAATIGDATTGAFARCGSRAIHVDLSGQLLVVASGAAPDDDLRAVADALSLDGDELVGTAPDGWTEIGRLEAGWRRPAGATIATGIDTEVLVRRVTPAEATAIEAVTCPEPRSDLQPPTSVDPALYDEQEPRDVATQVGPARVGVIGVGELAAVVGDRLAVVQASYRPTFPTDAYLSGLVSGIEAVPDEAFDATAQAADQALGDDSVAATVTAGLDVVADPTVAGRRMVVVASGEGEAATLCSYVARSADGYRHGAVQPNLGGACIHDGPQVDDFEIGPSIDGFEAFHLLARVPPAVASVSATDASGRTVEATIVQAEGGRRLAVAVVVGVTVSGVTNTALDPFPIVSLFGGAVVVRWLDAADVVVAEATIG